MRRNSNFELACVGAKNLSFLDGIVLDRNKLTWCFRLDFGEEQSFFYFSHKGLYWWEMYFVVRIQNNMGQEHHGKSEYLMVERKHRKTPNKRQTKQEKAWIQIMFYVWSALRIQIPQAMLANLILSKNWMIPILIIRVIGYIKEMHFHLISF